MKKNFLFFIKKMDNYNTDFLVKQYGQFSMENLINIFGKLPPSKLNFLKNKSEELKNIINQNEEKIINIYYENYIETQVTRYEKSKIIDTLPISGSAKYAYYGDIITVDGKEYPLNNFKIILHDFDKSYRIVTGKSKIKERQYIPKCENTVELTIEFEYRVDNSQYFMNILKDLELNDLNKNIDKENLYYQNSKLVFYGMEIESYADNCTMSIKFVTHSGECYVLFHILDNGVYMGMLFYINNIIKLDLSYYPNVIELLEIALCDISTKEKLRIQSGKKMVYYKITNYNKKNIINIQKHVIKIPFDYIELYHA